MVSGEVISLKAHQVQVNTRVDEELKRVRELANAEFTENKKARGQMRLLMDQYKRAASDEVSAFQDKILEKVTKARATNAANKREMAKSLTVATENFYEKLAAQSKVAIRVRLRLSTGQGDKCGACHDTTTPLPRCHNCAAIPWFLASSLHPQNPRV